MKIVLFGLTVTSSWGNGHATTFRSLLKALAARGHMIDFIEKDVEWYRNHRDLPSPTFCTVHLYEEWNEASARLLAIARDADVIVVGSYFPDTIAAVEALLAHGSAPVVFYDIDTPVTLAALKANGRTDYLTAALIPDFACYLSFSGGLRSRHWSKPLARARLGSSAVQSIRTCTVPSLHRNALPAT